MSHYPTADEMAVAEMYEEIIAFLRRVASGATTGIMRDAQDLLNDIADYECD